MILLLLLACIPAPTTPKLIEMCRDDQAGAESQAQAAMSDGWRYQGPAYNDGINCTVTLWAK